MAKIILSNDISIIQTDNQELIKFLFDSLRFRDRAYFHNPRYKAKLWDGYTNFFNKNTLISKK